MKVQKLSFQIEDCSGNDPDHPAQDLLVPNHYVTGWQSERFCSFPQTITIKLLHGISRIFKIQILLHHYKIPTKIEVSTGDSNSNYTKLGHVSIKDNDKNQYKVRELKTIHIDSRATYLKFTVFKCHINPLNLYNQVAIVALNILGTPSDANQNQDLSLESPFLFQPNQITRGIIERSFADQNTPMDSDLNYIDHDRYLVHALTALSEKKKLAVQNDDYSLAKQIKNLQTEIGDISNLVMTLLAEKRAALKLEDFDNAGAIQSRINGLKNDVAFKLKESGYELQNEGLTSLTESSITGTEGYKPAPANYYDLLSTPSINEIPINSKISKENALKSSRPATAIRSNHLEDLSEQQLEDYSLAIKIFGLDTTTKILSFQFNYREEGLNAANQFLKSAHSKSPNSNMDEITGALFQVLSLIISDSREKCQGLMFNLYQAFFGLCDAEQYPLEYVLPYITDLFPSIINKAADINPRIREWSKTLVMAIVEKFHTPNLNILPVLIKPYANTSLQSIAWKYVKIRLDVINELLLKYGVSDSKISHSEIGWTSHKIIHFTKPFVFHNKPEVRDSAISVLCKIAELVPGILNELADLPPVALDQIQKCASFNQGSVLVQGKDELGQGCIFCNLRDTKLNEELMDQHYWKECPMLVQCADCEMLVEIPDLVQHRLNDCDPMLNYQWCPTCEMAFKETDRQKHISSCSCRVLNHTMTRCPLCCEDFNDGLFFHLTKDGCPDSKRKPIRPRKKGFFSFS